MVDTSTPQSASLRRLVPRIFSRAQPAGAVDTLIRTVRMHHPKADLSVMSKSLFSETQNAGTGFGLGFAVTIDVARSMMPGSVGEFYWGGMFSTAFFIDPVERIHMVFMTQLSPSSVYPIRRELKTMIYSALT